MQSCHIGVLQMEIVMHGHLIPCFCHILISWFISPNGQKLCNATCHEGWFEQYPHCVSPQIGGCTPFFLRVWQNAHFAKRLSPLVDSCTLQTQFCCFCLTIFFQQRVQMLSALDWHGMQLLVWLPNDVHYFVYYLYVRFLHKFSMQHLRYFSYIATHWFSQSMVIKRQCKYC